MKSKLQKIAIVTIVLIGLSSQTLPAQSQEPRSISFAYLNSPDKGENSALSGKCTGNTASYEIECHFWQIRVRLALNPDDLPKEIEKAKRRLKEEAKEAKGFDKYIKKLCDVIIKDSAEMKQALETTDRLTSYEIKKLMK